MSNNIKKYPDINRLYKHYKGGKYEVISMATHSETGEAVVVYKSIHFGSVYVRPLSQWFELVTLSKENEPLKQVQRFEETDW